MKYGTAIAAASALFFSSTVSAHGGIVLYSFNGQVYQGYDPGRASIKRRTKAWVPAPRDALIQRQWASYNPQRDIGSAATICNDPGSPATAYAEIAAGGTVSACYNQPWAHNSGPLTVYMAACPNGDCAALAAADLPALKWFAIYKEGLVNGKWATEMYMESNSNCVTHMIPETLAAGSYLIRHETINLAKLEFYANCANVKVTGSGTATPDGAFLATISEIYKAGDPGLVDINGNAPDSYTIPGPNVWPDNTAEGGQVFDVTGVKNPCSGKAQAKGGPCQDGGDDTKTPTPPNPQGKTSSSSSSGASSAGNPSKDSSSTGSSSTGSSSTGSSSKGSSSKGSSSKGSSSKGSSSGGSSSGGSSSKDSSSSSSSSPSYNYFWPWGFRG